MIIEAQIISQPYAGQYRERIYDVSSPWNSQRWTWIKFLNDDFSEWCGEFRGEPRSIAISAKYNHVLILTSDYLYQLDCLSEEVIEYESQPQFHNLIVTPLGDFIVADYYSINLIKSTLKDKIILESPIKMDTIEFHNWSNNKLLITCDEFLNWSNHMELELDCETFEVVAKK